MAASGNASTNNDRSPHYPSSYNIPNVISVAALDRNDQLASFSNYGVKSVAIAAPGVDILSTWLGDEYEEKSGTSMATPVVAGVAALVAAHDPKITVDELRTRLLSSVDPLNSLKGKIASGGRINAAKASNKISNLRSSDLTVLVAIQLATQKKSRAGKSHSKLFNLLLRFFEI